MTNKTQIAELRDALIAALEWIDAVPSDTELPAMPGFDRDYVDSLIAGLKPAAPIVVLPDECVTKQAYCWMRSTSLSGNYKDGWNDCIAKTKRLNGIEDKSADGEGE